LHTKIDTLAKSATEEDKAKYAEIDRQLDECDRLLDRLTSASRSTFDKVKSAYERERGEALKAIDGLTKK
jgi:hypothetical protein